MGEERLTNSTLLNIETELIKNFQLIENIANLKGRRVKR